MRVALALLLVSTFSYATRCPHILKIRAHAKTPFVIAVDFDATIVDTDTHLVRKIIPKTIERVVELVPPKERAAFAKYLDKLESEPVQYPEMYEESLWREWGFPVDSLPESITCGSPRPDIFPLLAFWDMMAETFQKESRAEIPVIPAFQRFYEAANQEFGAAVSWVVVTARHDELVSDVGPILDTFSSPTHPFDLVTRGANRPLVSGEIAARKGTQIQAYRSPQGNEIRVFLDNDPRNLLRVREECGQSVLLLQMRRKGHQPELVDFP